MDDDPQGIVNERSVWRGLGKPVEVNRVRTPQDLLIIPESDEMSVRVEEADANCGQDWKRDEEHDEQQCWGEESDS